MNVMLFSKYFGCFIYIMIIKKKKERKESGSLVKPSSCRIKFSKLYEPTRPHSHFVTVTKGSYGIQSPPGGLV